LVQLKVNARGRAQDLQVLSTSHRGFGEEIEARARQWRFRPARLDGEVIEVEVLIAVVFSRD
jgi:TonB family protein